MKRLKEKLGDKCLKMQLHYVSVQQHFPALERLQTNNFSAYIISAAVFLLAQRVYLPGKKVNKGDL